jgi:hypothetical protein
MTMKELGERSPSKQMVRDEAEQGVSADERQGVVNCHEPAADLYRFFFVTPA